MTDQLSTLERMTTAGATTVAALGADATPTAGEEMHGPALPIVCGGELCEAFSSTPSLARFGRAGQTLAPRPVV